MKYPPLVQNLLEKLSQDPEYTNPRNEILHHFNPDFAVEGNMTACRIFRYESSPSIC